jgi:hypothetical protein
MSKSLLWHEMRISCCHCVNFSNQRRAESRYRVVLTGFDRLNRRGPDVTFDRPPSS